MGPDQIKQLLRSAYQYASLSSQDTSTHVGATIITCNQRVVFGANRFTDASFHTIENQERPHKYQLIEHAERAAIFEAARLGYYLSGAILVCPWASCPDCARAIVLSGIKQVYAHQDAYDKTPERWQDAVNLGLKILESSGVEYIRYPGKIGDCSNLFDGRVWHP